MNNINLCKTPLFTLVDYGIVRQALTDLPKIMTMVVEMRFWKNRAICEIAMELGVSAAIVERWLNTALKRLREHCLRHPEFSRSQHRMIEALRKAA